MALRVLWVAVLVNVAAEEQCESQPARGACLLQEQRKRTRSLSQSRLLVATKKGVGLPSSTGYGATQLHALNVSWFYSWGLKPKIDVPDDVEFVPIMQNAKYLQWNPASGSHELLGFNEPDHEDQANMSVAEALSLWPEVEAKVPSNGRLGSPATAGNPVTGSWFPEFMAAEPHVDFVCVHWYKGAKPEKFKSDMQAGLHIMKTML
ncbi:unnamed protein product [Durusdinium trenchii]|uniref:Asl1-like glycosyl hydrolase catalytic domain-containing protein n=1 Tax=Durusdinium trenchii TaxID=1381693 RepID=A0ABP0HX48_9DINO